MVSKQALRRFLEVLTLEETFAVISDANWRGVQGESECQQKRPRQVR
jgi:hypothetical protein